LPVIVLANSLHGLIDSLTWLKGIFELIPTSAAITRVFNFSRGRFEERQAKVCCFLVISSAIAEQVDRAGLPTSATSSITSWLKTAILE
jgi:hypothetical protein